MKRVLNVAKGVFAILFWVACVAFMSWYDTGEGYSTSRVSGGQLNPNEDLKLTARWGYSGRAGVITSGKGKLVERDFTSSEREAMERGAKDLGLSVEEVAAHLGEIHTWSGRQSPTLLVDPPPESGISIPLVSTLCF